MESNEIANGMWPAWINLHQAISHNEAVMQRQESSMGQSIQRETFMLKKVASGLMPQISRCDHISSAFGMEKGNHTSSD